MSKLKYFDGTNWNEVGGKIAGDTLPIGAIVPFSGEIAPAGWMLCIGQTLNKNVYPELFNVIGYTFGGEDGGDIFNLPNLKGKVIVGQDTSQTEFEDIGQTGGEKAHTLTASEVPQLTFDTYVSRPVATQGGYPDGNWFAYGSSEDHVLQRGSKITTNAGGGSHNILQPYMVTNYIIKVKQTAGLVGAVSDSYSTSHTDTYSCDYINNELNSYSTTEQIIGTWIDGKPIYRKVVVTDPITTDMGTSFSFTIATGIETLTNASAFTQTTGHARYLPILAQQVQLESDWDLDRSSHTLYLYLKRPDDTSYSNGVIHCIIEYTKTTN